MTQPIFNTEVSGTPATFTDDTRIFHDTPNWFPKYERKVYDWDSTHLYMHGDSVVSPASTWTDINGNHKNAEKIVWMCILPELCSVQSPGAYYSSSQKSNYPNYRKMLFTAPDSHDNYNKYRKDYLAGAGTSAVARWMINFVNAVDVKYLRPEGNVLNTPADAYRQIFVDEVWERRDHEVAATTKLTSANLNNVNKKAYSWDGPYGEREDNVSGILKNYRFKQGDHVCFTADASAGITARVYECTHETECVEFKPYDLRIGEYFVDRFDQATLTPASTNLYVNA
jgi:hypothetical protein